MCPIAPMHSSIVHKSSFSVLGGRGVKWDDISLKETTHKNNITVLEPNGAILAEIKTQPTFLESLARESEGWSPRFSPHGGPEERQDLCQTKP